MSPPPSPAESRVERALWRVVALLRAATLAYAAVTAVADRRHLDRAWVAVLVLAVMAVWTVVVSLRRPGGALLAGDLAIAAGAVLATRLAEPAAYVDGGGPTLPLTWVVGAVVAWALRWGWPGGLVAGAVVGAADLVERGAVVQTTANGVVLLVLVGLLVGALAALARQAEAAADEAARVAAAAEERSRLAAAVHDGVLQVLALAQREASPGLRAEAAVQERALRSLLARPAVADAAAADLLALLPAAGAEVVGPLGPVELPRATAEAVAAAVAAALDNVARHAGADAHSWVLVDDDGAVVRVTVRDSGVGIPAGRLAAAEREGRLGWAASVRGRVEAVGGTATVRSSGDGTEVELVVPR